MKAWALIGYPQKPQKVAVAKTEAGDSHTEPMCILEDGTRVFRFLVFKSKPKYELVTDMYGQCHRWIGEQF